MFVKNRKSHLFKSIICFALVFVCVFEIIALSGCYDSRQAKAPASKPGMVDNSKSGQVTLKWNNVHNATSYNVYYSKFPGVNKNNGRKISNAANSITITDLEPGTTYYFVVTAVNKSGESEESEELSFTVGK
jgi:predicted phage tail protein